MKPECRVALSCHSWRVSCLMPNVHGRYTSERGVKGEEDPHALARPVLGLGVLDGLREELRQLRNSLFHACLVDGTDVLQDRRQWELFIHEVLVVEDLSQESDEVIVQHSGEPVSVSDLNNIQELLNPGLFLFC